MEEKILEEKILNEEMKQENQASQAGLVSLSNIQNKFLNACSLSYLVKALDYSEVEEIMSHVGSENGKLTYDDGNRYKIFNVDSENYLVPIIILQWIYKDSLLYISNVPNGETVFGKSRESCEDSGIYLYSSEIGNIDGFRRSQQLKRVILFIEDVELEDLINSNVIDKIYWPKYKRLYTDYGSEDLSTLKQLLIDRKKSEVASITLAEVRTITSELKQIFSSTQVIDVREDPEIQEFLMGGYTSLSYEKQVMLLESLRQRFMQQYQTDNCMTPIWITGQIREEMRMQYLNKSRGLGSGLGSGLGDGLGSGVGTAVLTPLINILAALQICTGVQVITEANSDIARHFFNAVCEITSLKYGTMLQKINRLNFLKSQIYVYDEEAGEFDKALAIGIVRDKPAPNMCALKEVRDRSVLFLKPWKEILNTLEYTEETYYRVPEARDIFTYSLPKYKVKTIKTESSTAMKMSLVQAMEDFNLYDLDLIPDADFRLFTGEDQKWDFNDAFTKTKKKYCFWESVCRLMEQSVLDENGKPYSKYVTVRDLVLLRDKNSGELYLGYCNLDCQYDVVMYDGSIISNKVLDTFDYMPANCLQDFYNDDMCQDILIKFKEAGDRIDKEAFSRPFVMMDYDFDVFSPTNTILESKVMLQAMYYLCQYNQTSADRTLSALDVFEYELADPYNVNIYGKLDEISKILTPYGARCCSSVVNIFGGLNVSQFDNDQAYEFTPGPVTQMRQINISNKHLVKYPG